MAIGKRKKYLINGFIILLITGLTAFYLLKSETVTVEGVFSIPFYAFLICFALFAACILASAFIERFIYGTFTDEITFGKSFFTVLFGNFGSSITPFRSGHFPLMAYYHYKAGVSVGTTVTGFLKCQIIYSAVSIVVYFAVTLYLLINGLTADIGGVSVNLWIVVATGLGFHAAVFTVVIVLSFSERLKYGTLKLVGKIAKKIRKTFDEEKFFTEQAEKLARFKDQIKIIGKSFYKYLLPAALYAVQMAVSGGLQYAAYLLIAGEGFSFSGFFTFYVFNLTSTYITNVIPLPGAAGTTELLFLLVFKSIVSDPLLGNTLILWRVSTYYLPVILEFIIFLSVSVRKRKIPVGIAQSAAENQNGDPNAAELR